MPDPTVAAQATTAAPAIETAAPVNPTPDAATTTDTTAAALPKAPRTPSLGQQSPAFPRPRGPAAALERARVALEAAEAAKVAEPAKPAEVAESAKPADVPAAVESAKATEEKPAEPAKEPEKPAEKPPERISKGLAILAAREAKLRAREQAVKEQMVELQTKQAQSTTDPDMVLVKSVKDALAKGGRGAALKVLGIDLRTAIEEMSRDYVEPTPEDIARRVAQEELERHIKTLDEQQKAATAKAAEAEQVRVQVARTEYAQKVGHEFVSAADEFPYLAANEVLDTDVMLYAAKVEATTGKAPTPIEALRAYEKKLADAATKAAAVLAAKTKAAQPATIPPKVVVPAPLAAPSTTTKPKTDEPAKPRSRPESQPIPEAMKSRRFVPAHERARMAMESLKVH